MQNHFRSYGILFLLFVSLFFVLTECKGFGGAKGGGGFKGGSRGAGSFGGSSSFNRVGGYGSNMMKPSGGGLKRTAMSFAAGAAGGAVAYSLMRSMSGSGYRPGYYEPGYGRGETCVNKEDLNGTVFGTFRCPLNNFPYEARYCCGEYEKQFCCIREERRGLSQGTSPLLGILVIVTVLVIIVIFWRRHQRRQQKQVILVPTDMPPNDTQGAPYYHPAPPPMGYPPAPHGNPYAPAPTQEYPNTYNPYEQAPPGTMPYPPQQSQFNPYPRGPGGY